MSPVRLYLTALDSSAPESTKPKGGSTPAGMLAAKRTTVCYSITEAWKSFVKHMGDPLGTFTPNL